MRLFEHALRLDRMNTVAMTGLAHTSLLNVCHRRCASHSLQQRLLRGRSSRIVSQCKIARERA
jgi:hypothetical protein